MFEGDGANFRNRMEHDRINTGEFSKKFLAIFFIILKIVSETFNPAEYAMLKRFL